VGVFRLQTTLKSKGLFAKVLCLGLGIQVRVDCFRDDPGESFLASSGGHRQQTTSVFRLEFDGCSHHFIMADMHVHDKSA